MSSVTGTNIDSSSLAATDTVYVDWAVINDGSSATAGPFYTELYVDGSLSTFWKSDPPLKPNFYSHVQDYSIGFLPPGKHTLRIKTDSTGVIAESNESDNEYTRTITITGAGAPNLTPYQPSGWSDKIVVSKTTGTNNDSTPLTPTDTLYVDWAVINNGSQATAVRFYTELYVDGALRDFWFADPPRDPNFYSYIEDYSIGSLPAGTHTLRIKTDSTGVIAEINETDNEYTKTIVVTGTQPCTSGPNNLCLNNGRFKAQVNWRVPSQGTSGVGTAVPLTADTGYFWFFSSNNVELVIKALDGKGVNGKFWVFYGALSDVEYTLTVTDTATGVVKSYFNPQGRLASVADTSAFSALSAGASTSSIASLPDGNSSISAPTDGSGLAVRDLLDASAQRPSGMSPAADSIVVAETSAPCIPSSAVLCLNGNRFSVRAAWRVPSQGTNGVATAVTLTGDTGYFWFFSSNNVELVIKVLDGRPVNEKFWVFYGALSDVEYTITVTDTMTGVVRNYTNLQGRLASVADTAAFAEPLETTSQTVRAAAGATIAIPGGTVSIARGVLQSDQNVTVSIFPRPLRQPPGGKVVAVGTPVCLAFSPATQTSPLAPPAEATATGINVSIELSRTPTAELSGAVAFSELMVPTLPADSRDLFMGVPGSVDAIKRSATVGFSKGLLDWFEVTRSGSTATVCAELANWRTGNGAISTLAASPLATLPELLRFDGVSWVPAGPFELKDPGRTCVMIHGVRGQVEEAFATADGCMKEIKEKNGCDTVLGFNYRWYQSIDQSAHELATALAGRGLHHIVIEGHSLGGVVGMAAIPLLSGINIDHFVTLGSPMSGTPVASNVQNLITYLAYTLDNVTGTPLQPFSTFVNSVGIKDQLKQDSKFLNDARAAFLLQPGIPWTAAAGDRGEEGEKLSAFLCNYLPCDGLSTVASSLATDWPVAVNRLGVFHTIHTHLECDEDVVNGVGQSVNPFAISVGLVEVVPASMSFTMAVGGSAPSAQSFTVTNSSTQTNSRLSYSVARTQTWLALDGPLVPLGPRETAVFRVSIALIAAGSLANGTYSDVITVTDTAGSSAPKTIVVSLTVTGRSLAPTILSFTASPSSIAPGQTSTLSWTTTNATSVSISGLSGSQPINGSVLVTPAVTNAYTLTASGPGGAASAATTVTVIAAPPQALTLTVSKAGSGAGNVSGGLISCGTTCSAGFASGASVTLTETPATGSTFGGWSGACSGTATSCSITMNTNQSVTATFNSDSIPPEVFIGSFSGTLDGPLANRTTSDGCQYTVSVSGTMRLSFTSNRDGTIIYDYPSVTGTNTLVYTTLYSPLGINCSRATLTQTAAGVVEGGPTNVTGTFAVPFFIMHWNGTRTASVITGSGIVDYTFVGTGSSTLTSPISNIRLTKQ